LGQRTRPTKALRSAIAERWPAAPANAVPRARSESVSAKPPTGSTRGGRGCKARLAERFAVPGAEPVVETLEAFCRKGSLHQAALARRLAVRA
jgi:hypothetical protein